jgi:hypothetical protein
MDSEDTFLAKYKDYMFKEYGPAKPFWLSIDVDGYPADQELLSKPPTFGGTQVSNLLSRTRLKDALKNFGNKILDDLDTALPVFSLDSTCTKFALIVHGETWSRYKVVITEAVESLFKITNDKEASANFVIDTITFYLDEASRKIQSHRQLSIPKLHETVCKYDFFDSIKKFLSDMKTGFIKETSSHFGEVSYLRPIEFETKFAIHLVDPEIQKLRIENLAPETAESINHINLNQKSLEGCVQSLSAFSKESIEDDFTDGHNLGENYIDDCSEPETDSNVIPDDVTASSESCTVKLTKSTLHVYLKVAPAAAETRDLNGRQIYWFKYEESSKYTGASKHSATKDDLLEQISTKSDVKDGSSARKSDNDGKGEYDETINRGACKDEDKVSTEQAMKICDDTHPPKRCKMESSEGLDKESEEEGKILKKTYEFKLLTAHLILNHVTVDLSNLRQLSDELDNQITAAIKSNLFLDPRKIVERQLDKIYRSNESVTIKEEIPSPDEEACLESFRVILGRIGAAVKSLQFNINLIVKSSRRALLQYGPSEALEVWQHQSMSLYEYAYNCWKVAAYEGCNHQTKEYKEYLKSEDTHIQNMNIVLDDDDRKKLSDSINALSVNQYYKKFKNDIKPYLDKVQIKRFILKFIRIYCTNLIVCLIAQSEHSDEEDLRKILERIKLLDSSVFGNTFDLLKILAVIRDTCGDAFMGCFSVVLQHYYLMNSVNPDWKSIRTVIRLLTVSKYCLTTLNNIMNTYYLTTPHEAISKKPKTYYVFGLEICSLSLGWLLKLCGKPGGSFEVHINENPSSLRHAGMCLVGDIDDDLRFWSKKLTKFEVEPREFLKKVIQHTDPKEMFKESKKKLLLFHKRLLHLDELASCGDSETAQRRNKEIKDLQMQCQLHILLFIFLLDPKRFTFYLNLAYRAFTECFTFAKSPALFMIIKSVNHKVDSAQKAKGQDQKSESFAFEFIFSDFFQLVLLYADLQSRWKNGTKMEPDTLIFKLLSDNESHARYLFGKLLMSSTGSAAAYCGQINAYRRTFLNNLSLIKILIPHDTLTGGYENCADTQIQFYTNKLPYLANKYVRQHAEILRLFVTQLDFDKYRDSKASSFFKDAVNIIDQKKGEEMVSISFLKSDEHSSFMEGMKLEVNQYLQMVEAY